MNIIKEILELKEKVQKLYCSMGGGGTFIEVDPTVPQHVKEITKEDINNWNLVQEAEVIITEDTTFASVNDTQLIFNRNISDYIDDIQITFVDRFSIGEVTATTSQVSLALNTETLENWAFIDGNKYTEIESEIFPYTPVSPGFIKELILYATPTSDVFRLAEGQEGSVAITPNYNGLLIKRIIVSDTNIIIDGESDTMYKFRSDDTWNPVLLNNDDAYWAYGNRTSYEILATNLVNTPTLAGLKINNYHSMWDGKKMLIRNNTDKPLLLKQSTAPIDSFSYFSFEEDKVIPVGRDIWVVLINDVLSYQKDEILTEIEQPTLVGNILTIKYRGESGNLQEQTVDLSNLATIDIHINDASYNTSTNILTITDSEGNEYSVDLSEFSILTSTDANGITTLTQEGVIKLVISKVGQTGSYNDLLDKPTIPPPVDISNKLDKPTVDGIWVVTKTGTTVGYADASTLGKNISNDNLTWTVDRTQNLNAKKLIFTGGRFSVPTLEMEVTTATTVANKIWLDSSQLYHTDSIGINRRVAYDNQIVRTISSNTVLNDTYHNCIVVILANCTVTIPAGLKAEFNCVFDVYGNAVATFVLGAGVTVNSPFGLIFGNNGMSTLYATGTNAYRINGGLSPNTSPLNNKDIVGNITLDESYHNSYCQIKANCVITVPIGLRNDFECFFDVVGSFTAEYVFSAGVTFTAPYGRFLKDNLRAMLKSTAYNVYRLTGDLLTI